jgi:two-component system OmpR family response regulator
MGDMGSGDETTSERRRVAIVDDQPDVRAILRLLLERAGLDIGFEAATAEELLDAATPACQSVVILDHNLDGPLTGLQAAPLLKERSPDVTIVLFSAHDLQAEAAAEPAVDVFVRKDRILDLPDVIADASS